MDAKAITGHIRQILTAPDVDLATISSKKVRKVLAESFGASLIKENKEAIDALIIEAFNSIATAAGAASAAAAAPEPSHTNTVKTESPERQSASYAAGAGAAAAAQNGTATAVKAESSNSNSASKQRERDRIKQQQPEESDASEEEDQDYASGSTSDEASSKKPANIKSSPQKRKIEAVASSSFPASSPNVPLAMTTALTDEEYARKLQEEFNNMAGTGRSTRGSGSRSASSNKKGKKSSSSKRSKGDTANGSSKKYRSKAYIDDSDLEGEEGHHDSGSGSDDAPKKKKRKAPSSSGGGGGGSGGGYNKELALSEPLQKVCGVPTMSRPKIVKRLWEYIREHELQDPNKRSDIINDDLFREIFGVEKMTMFSMNKYLSKNVSPIDG